MHEYSVASGGTEKTTYMASFNANQKGIILNTGMKNYVGSMNITQKIGNRMQLVMRANYAEKERTGMQVNYGQGLLLICIKCGHTDLFPQTVWT